MSHAAIDKAANIWLAAVQQPIGLGVVVTDPMRAKAQLYAGRKKLAANGVPGLFQFAIRTSPEEPACHLWLMRDPSKAEGA